MLFCFKHIILQNLWGVRSGYPKTGRRVYFIIFKVKIYSAKMLLCQEPGEYYPIDLPEFKPKNNLVVE
jgi:hypothetical protein